MRQRRPQSAASMLPSSHSANRVQRQNQGGRFETGCCYQLIVERRRWKRVRFWLIIAFFTTLVRTWSSCASLVRGRKGLNAGTSTSAEQSAGGSRASGRSHSGSDDSTRGATPNSVGGTLRSTSRNDTPAGPVAGDFLRTSSLSDPLGAPDDFTTDGPLNKIVDSAEGASADSGVETERASPTNRSRVPSNISEDPTQALMSGYVEGTEGVPDGHPGATDFIESAQTPSPSSSPCFLKPRASEALPREINKPQQRLECEHSFPSDGIHAQACDIGNFPSCCKGVNGRHRDEQGLPAAAIAAAAPWGVPTTVLDGEDVVAPVPVSAATTAVGLAPWESAIWAPGEEIATTVSFASPGPRKTLGALGWVGRGVFSPGSAVAEKENSPVRPSPGGRDTSSLPFPGSDGLPLRFLWTPVDPEAGPLSASENSAQSFTTAAPTSSAEARGSITGSSIRRIGQTERGARFGDAVLREPECCMLPEVGLGGGVQRVLSSRQGHEEAPGFGKLSIPFKAAGGGDGESEKGYSAQVPHGYSAWSTCAPSRMHSDELITFRTRSASEKEKGNMGWSFCDNEGGVTECKVAAPFQESSTPRGDDPGAVYTASQFLWGAQTLPSMPSLLRTDLRGQPHLFSGATFDDAGAPGARAPTPGSDASQIPACSRTSQGGFGRCRPFDFSGSGTNASLDSRGCPLRKPRYVVPELPPRLKKPGRLHDPATLWNGDYMIETTGPVRIQAHHVGGPKDRSARRTLSESSITVLSTQNTIAAHDLEWSGRSTGGDTGAPRRAPLYSEVVRGIAGARACSGGGSLSSVVVVGKGNLSGPEPKPYDIGSRSCPLGSLPSVKKGHQLNPLAPEFQPRFTTAESNGTNTSSRDAIGSHAQAGTSEARKPVLLATNQYTGGEVTRTSVSGSQRLLRTTPSVSLPYSMRGAGPPESRRFAHGLTQQRTALIGTHSLTTFFGGVLQPFEKKQQMRGRPVRQALSSAFGNLGLELRQESRTPGLVDRMCHLLHHQQVSGIVSPLYLLLQEARNPGSGTCVPQLLQPSHVALLVSIFAHVLQHPSTSWPGRFFRQSRWLARSPRARSPRLERCGDRGATSAQSSGLFGEESHRPPQLSSYGPKKTSAAKAKKEQQLLLRLLSQQQQHVVPAPAESVTRQQDRDDGACSSPCGETSSQEADVERLPSSEVGTPTRPPHSRSTASTGPAPSTISVNLPAEASSTVRMARTACAPAISSSGKSPGGKGQQRACDPPGMPVNMCGREGRRRAAGDYVTTLSGETASDESGTNSSSDADTATLSLPVSVTLVGPATLASAAADDAKSERASINACSASSDGEQIC